MRAKQIDWSTLDWSVLVPKRLSDFDLLSLKFVVV